MFDVGVPVRLAAIMRLVCKYLDQQFYSVASLCMFVETYSAHSCLNGDVPDPWYRLHLIRHCLEALQEASWRMSLTALAVQARNCLDDNISHHISSFPDHLQKPLRSNQGFHIPSSKVADDRS